MMAHAWFLFLGCLGGLRSSAAGLELLYLTYCLCGQHIDTAGGFN
jgi:hypothetical protein